MLFISNNKKIDAVIKKLQPSLKLKINIERDFDCGLNDVFEKRPDVVFIQNQIAGVTGESVARHIQLLLGGAAPKFIFIHDGDVKAKPKKGLYEDLIDLSQDVEAVAADILEKLNLLLGPQWQNVFVTSVLQGVDYEAFTPSQEPSLDPASSFSFDVLPGTEPVVPGPTSSASPLSLISEIAPDESFDIVTVTDGQPPAAMYEECGGGAKGTPIVSGNNLPPSGIVTSSESAIHSVNGDVFAAVSETSTQAIPGAPEPPGKTDRTKPAGDKSKSIAGLSPPFVEDTPPVVNVAPADQNPLVAVAAATTGPKTPKIRPQLPPETGVKREGAPLPTAHEELRWAFEGEPRLKKSTWKWYQVVELLLVLMLLIGGWYLIKQKMNPAEPGANEVNLLKSAASPPVTPESVPAGQQSLTVAVPAFIPVAGLDPEFAAQNPGWERYAGDGSEFRLFRENGRLKAVQVKAAKGHVISDALLKSILVELTGSGEYRVKSKENKLGFLVVNAMVNGKAELLIYTRKSAMHAVVVSLD